MPKIPRYEAKVHYEGDIAKIRAAGEMGEAVFNIGARLQKIRQEEEIGRATIEANKQINNLELEAMKDTDVVGFDERYDKKVKDIRENTSRMFRDRQAHAEFMRRFDVELSNVQFKLKKLSYGKLIEQRRNTLFNEEIPGYIDNYLSETEEGLKQGYIHQIAAAFKRAADTGIISPKDAGDNFAKIKAELPEKQADWDILQNPVNALAELQKGEQGIYKGLKSDDRVSLIKQAETREDKVNKQEVQRIAIANEQGERDIIDMKFSGTLTEKIIDQYEATEKIDHKFAEAIRQNIRSPKAVDAKTDPETYMELVTLILSPTRSVSEVRQELLKATKEGKLSETDFKKLYTSKMIPGQQGAFSIAEEYSDEMAKATEPAKFSFLRNAVEMLKSFANVADPRRAVMLSASLVRKLFTKLSEGNVADNDIPTVAKDIVKEKIRADNPMVGFLDDVPNAIANQGAIKEGYPGVSQLKTQSEYQGEIDRDTEYKLGDTITHNGIMYVVIDFDTDGEPLLEEVNSAD